MPEWLVRLAGRERDLRFLATALRDPWRITEEASKFYLGSSRFEGLGDAGEVKRLADEFVDWADLHALLRFEGYQGVQTAEIVGLDPNGSSRATVTIFAAAFASGRATVFGSATIIGSQPTPPPDLTRDTSLLRQRPRLAKAVKYVREEPGWYGYWKATEAFGEEIGGLDEIVSRGWATQDQYDRFYKTVHHHRHHRVPAPANPMREDEVRSLLLGWLRRCLDWRLSERR